MKRLNCIVLVFILFVNYVNTYLTINNLRSTHSIFRKEFKHLSPHYGALLTESDTLLRIYLSSEQTATTNLVKKLFRLNWNQFYPTVARNNPASYFDVEDIAILILLIETNGTVDLTELLKQKLIAKAEKIYPKEFNRKTFKTHLNKIILLIKDSLQECQSNGNQIYPVYTTQAILLSLLYQKSYTKNDILTYILTMSKYINVLNNNLIIIDEQFQNLWLSLDYSPKHYLSFEKILSHTQWTIKSNNQLFIQFITCSLIARKKYLSLQLPQVPQGYFNYQDAKEIVADCQETAIREFCNSLFYNHQTKQFDLSKFTNLKFNKELINFYIQDQANPTMIKSQIVGKRWYNIMSGKENIEYVNKNYNMRPTIANFVNTINYLFGISATNIQELALLISNDHYKIKISHDTLMTKDGPANVLNFDCLDCTTQPNVIFNIKIHMIPDYPNWHAWTIIDYCIQNNDFINSDLKFKLISLINDNSEINDFEKTNLLSLLT